MQKILLALLGFTLLSTPLAATAQQFGDFTYSSDGSAITITGYAGIGGAVTIPDTIAGLPVTRIGDNVFLSKNSLANITIPGSVTSIGDQAFNHCTGLTNVTIPGSLTRIGNGAFDYCTSLTSVAIPGTVTSIGNYAFNYCTGLTNVTIPGSVTNMGSGAFASCTSLVAITVDAANASYSSLDGALFNKSQTTLIQCPGGKAGSYPIPGRVTSIGDYAFHYCGGLTNVTIPGSVTNLGSGAFASCASLASVTIPGSVTSIGYIAFFSCTSLKGVFFMGNAPSVSLLLFDGTRPTVYYLPGTTDWGPTFAGQPTSLWNPVMLTSGPGFGVGPAGFGFNITGTANIPIVVEAATNLVNATWVPLQSLNLTNGAFHFSDPNWVDYPTRSYRIRSP